MPAKLLLGDSGVAGEAGNAEKGDGVVTAGVAGTKGSIGLGLKGIL